jgi:SAM-dependent methyltransferase
MRSQFELDADPLDSLDALDEPGPYPLDLVMGMCDPRDDDRYLDLGSGLGTLVRMVGPHVGETVGVDLAMETLGVLRGRARGALPVGANAARLPFCGNTFTLVTMGRLLHHLADPREVLAELWDAVCPGGRLLVIEPVGRDHPQLRAIRDEVERARDPSHVGVLSAGQIRRLLEGSGFEVRGEERDVLDVQDDDWCLRVGAPVEPVRAALRRHRKLAGGFNSLRWEDGRFVFRRERGYWLAVRS